MNVARSNRTASLWAMAFAVTSAAAFATPLPAQSADKREYHLFNPTPRSLMREMSTDRPDVTESPYTVDAGHYQVELSFAEYGRDNDGPDVEEWSVLPVVLKAGLTYNVDLQLVVTPYIDLDVAGDSVSGFGETQLRLKVNLWGNDGPDDRFGDSALAVMPFVQFPTGDEDLGFSDQVEGGVIFPFATSLPNEFDLGLMAEFDFVHDDFADEYDLLFVHTAAVGRDLTDELGAYVEYIGVAGDGDYAAAVGLGATYALSPDVQLDAGVNVGLNDDAEDFRLFTGLSFRL
jgi:hypothetical protein